MDLSSLYIVKTTEAAQTLLKPDTIDLLRPLMTQALTSQELSTVLGQPFMKVHYRIKKLLELQLLVVVETFISKGRERKRYQAKAKRFFVPFAMTQANDIKSFLKDFDNQWYEPMIESYVNCLQKSAINFDTFGIGLTLDKDDVFKFSLSDDPRDFSKKVSRLPDADSIWNTSYYLNLTDIESMQNEIRAVLLKYQQKRGEKKQGQQRYVVRFAYAPWKP
jgi:hypothetical protein